MDHQTGHAIKLHAPAPAFTLLWFIVLLFQPESELLHVAAAN
jgi:hypothetical protein